jgi:hypothetical protein
MSEKGFSEGRLAAAAGVDVKTVGRWVRGESLGRERRVDLPAQTRALRYVSQRSRMVLHSGLTFRIERN